MDVEEITTDDPKVRLRIRRNTKQMGQSYTVVAVTPTGRVLAVVEVQVPLERDYLLDDRIGRSAVEEIEADARSIAQRVAQGVLKNPQVTG